MPDSVDLFSRAPLHDPKAELALLGSMCIKADVIPAVRAIVASQDFHDRLHRRVFDMLLLLHDAKQPTDDPLILMQQARAMKIELTASYVGEMLETVPTARNATRYAESVCQLARRRRVVELSTELVKQAYDESETVEAITSYARQYIEILELGTARNLPRLIGEVMADLADDLGRPDRRSGVPTGFPGIDEMFGFLQATELTIIGARPGRGKTTFSMQIALHNAKCDRHVLYCSLEMGHLEFAKRLACLELGLDSRYLRDATCPPNERDAVRELAESWIRSKLPFSLWAPSSATETAIEARARYQHATQGLDLLIVDHLQITGCSNSRLDRYQQLGEITRRLKTLAKDLEIPLIAQCQLKRTEARPALSSLRESGDIEQNADNVWLLHREEDSTAADLIVAKFRHGPDGDYPIRFQEGRFSVPGESA